MIQSRWPPLTTTLIGLCLAVALLSGFGTSQEVLRPFFISDAPGTDLPEVRNGELWRLITPIFIHFGPLHLVFNMLWLWDLGGAVELLQGWRRLATLVTLAGVGSNIAQYYYAGPGFGGMSGVVYALLAYVWLYGRLAPQRGLFLHRQIALMMLVWYVLCWTGIFGPIANMAHTVGLLLGLGIGYVVMQRR